MVLSKGLREKMHILPCWGLMDQLSISPVLASFANGESLAMDSIKANPWHTIHCDST